MTQLSIFDVQMVMITDLHPDDLKYVNKDQYIGMIGYLDITRETDLNEKDLNKKVDIWFGGVLKLQSGGLEAFRYCKYKFI